MKKNIGWKVFLLIVVFVLMFTCTKSTAQGLPTGGPIGNEFAFDAIPNQLEVVYMVGVKIGNSKIKLQKLKNDSLYVLTQSDYNDEYIREYKVLGKAVFNPTTTIIGPSTLVYEYKDDKKKQQKVTLQLFF